MVMFKSGRIKTNAEYVQDVMNEAAAQQKQALWEQESINLYPEAELKDNMYIKLQEQNRAREKRIENLFQFQEDVKKELMFHTLYEGILDPVCEQMAMTSHQREVIANTVVDFINENDVNDLLDRFKYQNLYLAEFARLINESTDLIVETAKDSLKEGLSERDAFQIENDKINNYILNAKGVVPDNFATAVFDRVENAVDEFIDDNRKNKADIKRIYDIAREKAMQAEGDVEIQQEAVRVARRKEAEITNRITNVFGEMVRIVTESVHKIKPIQESYTNPNTNKIDFAKLVGDVKAIYTFMEAMNTTGVIDVTEEYTKDTLKNLREDTERVSQDDTYIPAGENQLPQEKDQDPSDDNNNNPADDFQAAIGGGSNDQTTVKLYDRNTNRG